MFVCESYIWKHLVMIYIKKHKLCNPLTLCSRSERIHGSLNSPKHTLLKYEAWSLNILIIVLHVYIRKVQSSVSVKWVVITSEKRGKMEIRDLNILCISIIKLLFYQSFVGLSVTQHIHDGYLIRSVKWAFIMSEQCSPNLSWGPCPASSPCLPHLSPDSTHQLVRTGCKTWTECVWSLGRHTPCAGQGSSRTGLGSTVSEQYWKHANIQLLFIFRIKSTWLIIFLIKYIITRSLEPEHKVHFNLTRFILIKLFYLWLMLLYLLCK